MDRSVIFLLDRSVSSLHSQPRNSLELQTVPEDQMMEIPRFFTVSFFFFFLYFHVLFFIIGCLMGISFHINTVHGLTLTHTIFALFITFCTYFTSVGYP